VRSVTLVEEIFPRSGPRTLVSGDTSARVWRRPGDGSHSSWQHGEACRPTLAGGQTQYF
jgi:hypothetical protein